MSDQHQDLTGGEALDQAKEYAQEHPAQAKGAIDALEEPPVAQPAQVGPRNARVVEIAGADGPPARQREQGLLIERETLSRQRAEAGLIRLEDCLCDRPTAGMADTLRERGDKHPAATRPEPPKPEPEEPEEPQEPEEPSDKEPDREKDPEGHKAWKERQR